MKRDVKVARNQELNRQMKDARKESILTSALELFAKKGLAATKINDICVATGMSQGLMYHYYKSKEEIFTELIANAFERLNAACLWLEKQPVPPLQKIEMAISNILRDIKENKNHANYHLLVFQASISEAIPEEAKLIIKNKKDIPYKIIARIIKHGQEDGSIKKHNPEEMALVFWTLIKGLSVNKVAQGKKYKTPGSDILMSLFSN